MVKVKDLLYKLAGTLILINILWTGVPQEFTMHSLKGEYQRIQQLHRKSYRITRKQHEEQFDGEE